MNNELSNEEYAKAIRHRLNSANPDAVFILTSCNLTSEEMDSIFVGPFKRAGSITGYRQFTFGGVTGQVVSTNIYKAN